MGITIQGRGSLSAFIIFGVLILSVGASATASDKHQVLMKPEEASEDIDFLYEKLIDYHGGLDLHKDNTALKSDFQRVKRQLLNKPFLTIQDVLAATGPVIDGIRCRNTRLLLPREYGDRLAVRKVWFPLPLFFFDGRGYVDMPHQNIPVGTEIISINNTKLSALLSLILPLSARDGRIDRYKWVRLNADFQYYLMMVMPPSDSYQVTFRYPGSDSVVYVNLKGITRRALLGKYRQRHSLQLKASTRESLVFNNIPQLNAGWLTPGSFSHGTGDRDAWLSEIKTLFSTFQGRGVNYLVLDLRDNKSSGISSALTLYQFLTTRSFRVEKIESSRVSEIAWFDGLVAINGGAVDSASVSFANSYLSSFEEGSNGRYFWRHPINEQSSFKPLRQGFSKTLYILTNEKTGPAGTFLCRLSKNASRATRLGSETGGLYDGENGQIILTLSLPHSKIRVTIPVVKVRYSNAKKQKKKDRGIFPEYDYIITRGDFISGENSIPVQVLDRVEKDRARPFGRSVIYGGQ